MSLIENALEKLRRTSSSAGATSDAVNAREVGTSASGRGPLARQPASPEPALKRISIDWTAMRAAGYLPAEGQAQRFADHYRHIKRPLIEKALAADGTPDMRLILVSSALPGDGKTFTTVNLALSMARERDISVLLVDADVPKARVGQVFGLRNERGLMDALVDESLDVESLVLRTDTRGLDILPAGKPVENATELLVSARMAQIAARLATRNPRRLVLLDSPPLLGSSEGRALVRLPGQIVLVVRAYATPRQAVIDAIAHLDREKLQGLVLNQAPTARGSGYYYGYSSYGAVEKETAGAD